MNKPFLLRTSKYEIIGPLSAREVIQKMIPNSQGHALIGIDDELGPAGAHWIHFWNQSEIESVLGDEIPKSFYARSDSSHEKVSDQNTETLVLTRSLKMEAPWVFKLIAVALTALAVFFFLKVLSALQA